MHTIRGSTATAIGLAALFCGAFESLAASPSRTPAAIAAGKPGVAAAPAKPAAPLTVSLLADPPRSAAMSDSGLLATVNATGDAVMIYDKIAAGGGALAPPRKVPVGAGPQAVTFKRVGAQELFIVSCAGDRSIWLLDGRNGKLVRKIAVPGSAPRDVIAPQSPDCSIAYVALEQPAGTLAPLDLKTYKFGDLLQSTSGAFGTASPDGKVLYLTNDEEPVSIRLTPWLVPNVGATLTQSRRVILPNGRFDSDARGRYGIAGSIVTDPLMLRQSASLKGLNLLIVPDQPVSISIDDGDLVAYSTNTWTELKRIPLPADFVPAPTKESLDHNELVMFKMQEGRLTLQAIAYHRLKERALRGLPPVWSFYDRATKSLVLINDARLLSVPIASLALPKEPDLNFAINAPARVPVGETWTARVDADPKAELSVVEGPPGVSVAGQTLTFDATPADIGPATLTVRASVGELYHDESIRLDVSRPSVDVGGALVDRYAVSPDGTRLLVRAELPAGATGRPVWHLTLIDLKTFATIATRDVTDAVGRESLALSNDLAIMGLADADALLALSAKDLSDAGRHFTKGRFGRLIVRGDELYAAGETPPGSDPTLSRGNLVRYKLPAFEEDGRFEGVVFPEPPSDRSDPERFRVPYPVRDGTYFAGTVYADEALTKPRMLVAAVGFLAGENARVPFLPDRWGVELRSDGLIRNGGQLLRALPGVLWPCYAIDSNVPLLLYPAGTTGQPLPGSSRAMQRFELVAHDLADGDKAGSTPIAVEESPEGGSQPTMPMTMTPRGPVVAIRGRVYLVDEAEVRAFPTKPPLMVYPKSPQVVLSGPGPYVFEHVAENAEGTVKWTMKNAGPGVTLDEKSGRVTIDPAKVIAAVPAQLNSWATAWRSHGMIDGSVWETRNTRPPPPNELVESYIKGAADRATLLFGNPVSGVPYSISIDLEATDARGRSNVTFYTVLLELPTADVLAKF